MLLWWKQQQKNPMPEMPLHPKWLWAFVVVLIGLTGLGMWIEANLPLDPQRRAMLADPTSAYERNLGIALMIGLSASLLVRWRSQYGYLIRYGVYWLVGVGGLMIGYAAWYGLLW